MYIIKNWLRGGERRWLNYNFKVYTNNSNSENNASETLGSLSAF